jgi:hypothetical protein
MMNAMELHATRNKYAALANGRVIDFSPSPANFHETVLRLRLIFISGVADIARVEMIELPPRRYNGDQKEKM